MHSAVMLDATTGNQTLRNILTTVMDSSYAST